MRVTALAAQLRRGLLLIESLVQANVAEFKAHLSTVIDILLEGALLRGRDLIGNGAYDTFLVSVEFPSSIYLTLQSSCWHNAVLIVSILFVNGSVWLLSDASGPNLCQKTSSLKCWEVR